MYLDANLKQCPYSSNYMAVHIQLGTTKGPTYVTVQDITGFEEIVMITFFDVAILTATG